MNVAEKLAPLVKLQSGPPAHVHDVRFDEGADGEMWVYINAHPDPKGRAKQRFLCVVVRDDAAIAAELAGFEAELAAWTESAKAEAHSFVKRGFEALVEQRAATTTAHAQAVAIATAQAQHCLKLVARIESLRATIEPLRPEARPEVRAQVALLELELSRMVDGQDAQQRAAGEQHERALELGRDVEAIGLRVARAEAEFEADVSTRFSKMVPPPAIVERIEELRADLGCVSVHASDTNSRKHAEPGAVVEVVARHADWLRAVG